MNHSRKYLEPKNKPYWSIIYYQISTNINQDYCSIVLELVDGKYERYEEVISIENSGIFYILFRVPSGCKCISFDCGGSKAVSITFEGCKKISLQQLIFQFLKQSVVRVYQDGMGNYFSRYMKLLTNESNQRINLLISLTRKNRTLTNYSKWLELQSQKVAVQSTKSIAELVISDSDLTYKSVSISSPSEWVLLQCVECSLSEQYQAFIEYELDSVPSTIQLIYFDHDYLTSEGRTNPQFKSDWDNLLFEQNDYLGPIVLIRYSLAQYLLKYFSDKSANARKVISELVYKISSEEQVQHVPIVAYSIPSSKHTFSPYFLAEITKQQVTNTSTSLFTEYNFDIEYDSVTIIIPSRDNVRLLTRAINSILSLTTYSNYRILIVDNQSIQDETLVYLNDIENNQKVHVISYEHAFNYSAINNFAAVHIEQNVPSDYLLLLNDDTEIISPDWLTQMLACFSKRKVGIVGAKLYYPNNTIQHAGVTIGAGGVAGHTFKYFPRDSSGPMNLLGYVRQVSAVTGACLLTTSEIYKKLDGLDEVNLKVSFNDIDFCLKARNVGYKVVWTPHAELYHHESVSRGLDTKGRDKQRFKKEVSFMKNKWKTQYFKDPFYNRNLALNSNYCRLIHPRDL